MAKLESDKREIALEHLSSWARFLEYVHEVMTTSEEERVVRFCGVRELRVSGAPKGAWDNAKVEELDLSPVGYLLEHGRCLESLVVTALLAMWEPSYEGCNSLGEIAWDWEHGRWRSLIELEDSGLSLLHQRLYEELTCDNMWQELELLGLSVERTARAEGLAFLCAQHCRSLLEVRAILELVIPRLTGLAEEQQQKYISKVTDMLMEQGKSENIFEQLYQQLEAMS